MPRKLTQIEFENIIYELVGDEYTVLSEYQNMEKHVIFRHNCEECGNYEFVVTPAHIMDGRGCPSQKHKIMKSYIHIRVSSGEKAISDFLIDKNITFIPQYRFEDCKNINSLPFDFYLPDYNMCIEFDGAQHSQVVKAWGGEEGLKIRQENDAIKNRYCLNKNIHLLRIPYTKESDISLILTEELSL